MNSKFLVMNGDVYFHFDLRKLIREENLLIVKEMEDPSGSAVIIPEGNKVAKLVEKPPHPQSNLASSGIFVLPPDIFDAVDEIGLSSRGEYELPSAIQILIDRGMELKYIHGEWTDVGYPWDLLTVNEVLLRRMEGSVEGKVEERATIHGPVIVGEGSIIRNGSYLIGPVVIGKECDIGPNCFIRPYTSIGNKVRIGNGVEVKNSIIMDNTNIGHLSYVGDSIIGYNCNFGAGTIVANLRLDEKEVKVISKGEVYPTRRRKLGTIMGDNVHTGIGCLLNTGSIIPANSKLMPGEWVGGEYVEVR
jgi:bifunctional UDP-N-acetylglucosamine pyrophosphorylase/glucosamine-1-phosphate N-acetyltransferase